MALVGALIVGAISLIPFGSFIALIIHTMIGDPEATGYVFLFLTIPVLMFTSGAGFVATVSVTAILITLKLEEQKMGVWHIIIGGVNLLLMPLLIYFVNYFLLTTLTTTGYMQWLQNIIAEDSFHPSKLFYGIYYIGPLLIFIGGLMTYFNANKADVSEES